MPSNWVIFRDNLAARLVPDPEERQKISHSLKTIEKGAKEVLTGKSSQSSQAVVQQPSCTLAQSISSSTDVKEFNQQPVSIAPPLTGGYTGAPVGSGQHIDLDLD